MKDSTSYPMYDSPAENIVSHDAIAHIPSAILLPPPPVPRPRAKGFSGILSRHWGGIVVVFLLGFLATCLYVSSLEKLHVGRVRLQIMRSAYTPMLGSLTTKETPNWLETEFSILTSRETLMRVVRLQNLTKTWNMGTGQQAEQDAVTKLNKMLEISTEKGTDLVLVEVYSPIPREAADLANAVAASYEQCRKDYEKVKNENAIQALQLELDNQDKKVEEHRVSMLAIMKKYRIVDFEATNGGWKGAKGGVGNPSNEAQEMSAQQRLAEYRAETTKYETELRAVLQAATSEETLAVMEALNQDPVVIRELRQGLASATKAGSAEGIQTALKAITTAGETLQRTMETKVKLAKNIAQDLAQAHAVQQDDMLGDRARQSEYVMAKLGYQQESALMNDMKEHIMKQKVDLAMPMLPVRIHENAYPNAKVVRPNGEMLLATGSGIALMLGLALAFILEYGRRD